MVTDKVFLFAPFLVIEDSDTPRFAVVCICSLLTWNKWMVENLSMVIDESFYVVEDRRIAARRG